MNKTGRAPGNKPGANLPKEYNMENKKNKRHCILGCDTVELSTYGAYDERTDSQEMRFFCVPRSWAEDWVNAYDGRKFKEFLEEYTWDDTEYMYADAKRLGLLLPNSLDAENDKVHYYMSESNKELVDEINELSDASFYDVFMIMAQHFGISYLDVEGFCNKLRSILYEIQTNLVKEYEDDEEKFIETVDRNS